LQFHRGEAADDDRLELGVVLSAGTPAIVSEGKSSVSSVPPRITPSTFSVS
jgi:hypothetical protein